VAQRLFASDALAGKRILVTGGGGGLGLEIARAYAAHGAAVHISGRRKDVLESAARDLGAETGASVRAHVCDVRDPEAVDAMIEAASAEGPLTGLVNNAAANFVAPTKTLSPNGYRAIAATVMDGSFYATLAVGKRWIEQGLCGSVVSNLVTWIWTGSAYVTPSAMAKAALHAMTMSLAVEWAPYGIRLNAIAPGPFPTPGAWAKLNPMTETQSSATSAESVPMRRFGEMHELANLHVFLMSDACDYLTGATIPLDGAQHLAGPGTFADLMRVSDADWARVRDALRTPSAKSQTGSA
jgi:NAD(P)-dependent dehydrogenase (short-subunit alcohol dehydrogenase family)